MDNKTFGIVVGIIIAVALAMVVGLYMLGTSGINKGTFDKGYEDDLDDYIDDSFYFDSDGNMYQLDDTDFFEDNYDIIE